ELGGEVLHAGPGREPGVEARRLAKRGRAAASDPDGWAAGTGRLGLDGDAVEGEVLAAERDIVAAPKRAADLQRLEEAAHASLERHAHRGEFLPDGRRIGGDTHPEDH